MKVLLDNGLPRSTAAILGKSGFDAIHVADIGLKDGTDKAILDRAVAEGLDWRSLLVASSGGSAGSWRWAPRFQWVRGQLAAICCR